MKRTGKIYIGTSGWHYKHWKGSFYPKNIKEADQLSYYLQFFSSVEINNSFYRLPNPKTFAEWRKSVPGDFIFAVKGSRFITHMKKLNIEKQSIQKFFTSVKKLKEKAGPILFQLPPKWNVNAERLAFFLKQLPSDYRYAFEFRNPSWYTNEVYDLLKKHRCAFCVYELAGHISPIKITAAFVYLRLHGPGNKYQGDYPDDTLSNWAGKCRNWQQEGRDVYVYFDNDQAGYAAFNAGILQSMVDGR
jgi:uncharacterized protein YecE (DUF72 family)